MAIEIERKFLVNEKKLRECVTPFPAGNRITQGYLSDSPTVRIRTVEQNDTNGLVKAAALTVKGMGLISRAEYEYSIPFDEGLSMLEMCKTWLTKTRRHIQFGSRTWDVDEFHDTHSGLWLAEVELEAADATVEIPPWVTKEVSDDRRFQNVFLAREHYTFWQNLAFM